jgi:transmembrane sensor
MAIAKQEPSPFYSSGSKPLPATPKSPVLRTSRSRSLPRPALALVASILLAIFGLQVFFGTSVERYQTLKGEQKTISLADGSQIMLNTDTELTVSQSDSQRSVQLNHGEALFSVTHDPLRPFEVFAGSGRLRDIGTRFDVYAQADRVDVAVLEGEVDMMIAHKSVSRSLTAGQSAAYDINGNLLASRLTHMQAVTAWQNGKLIFTDLSLPEALTQIARYHSVEFQIADPKLRELKISGTFKTSNLPLLLKTLEAGFPVKINVIDPQHIRLQRTSRS